MKIEKSPGTMKVTGLIKTPEDSATFKTEMESLLGSGSSKTLSIHILDSFIVTSSIIGSMLRAKTLENTNITLYVYNNELYKMIEELRLVDILKVKIVK
jgi:hypothetical protein